MTPFFKDIFKSFKPGEATATTASLPTFPFDVATMMETQRQNMQACATMQQLMLESLQVIAHRQSALLSDLGTSQAEIIREWRSNDAPTDKIGDQALILKDMYEHLIAHMREIGDMVNQSSQETSNILHARVGASLAGIKDAVDRAKAKRVA